MTFRLGLGLGIIPPSVSVLPTSAPVNVVAPSIGGIQTQGQTLTADPGSWSGTPGSSYGYQWKRAGADISGATAGTYVQTGSDVAQLITVDVTATNIIGPTTATSAAITPAATLTISGTPGAPTVGSAYSYTPTSTGGHATKVFALTGSLPAGLSFSTSTGAITGTPTTSGTASGLNITVTDGDGLTAALGTFSLVVSSGAVAGDPIALTIRDATVTNFVNGSGWIADLMFKAMNTGGALDMSGTKKLQVVARRHGFEADGVAKTYDDIVEGTIGLRLPAPSQATMNQAALGSDVVIRTVLRKRIFGTCEMVSASIGAAAYVQGANSSRAATSIPALANNSTLTVPGAIWAFMNVPCEIAQGSTKYVEATVFHSQARLGQQAACVEFRVRAVGGADQGVSVKVNTPTLSTLYAKAGAKVEVFAANIPLTSLSQATEYEVYLVIYPWVGTTTDTRNFNTAMASSSNLVCLRFFCDKNGTYGDNVAYAQHGGTATGTTGVNNRAAPYATPALAATALATANNAKSGADQHNNVGGSRVRLMEDSPGAGATWAGYGGAMFTQTTGIKTWYTLEVDPLATGVVKFVTGASKNPGFLPCVDGILLERAVVGAGSTNDDAILDIGAIAATDRYFMWIKNCSMSPASDPATLAPFRRYTTFLTGFTLLATYSLFWKPNGSEPTQFAMVAGCDFQARAGTATGNNSMFKGPVFVGNLCAQSNGMNAQTVAAGADGNDNFVWAYNKFARQGQVITSTGRSSGGVFWGNLVEIVTNGNNAGVFMSADADGTSATNFIIGHNTIVGDRLNGMYTASGITAENLTKKGVEAYDLTRFQNVKSDYFWAVDDANGDGNDQTGNWEWRYFVDRVGLVNTEGASNAGAVGPVSWFGEHTPSDCVFSGTVGFVSELQIGHGAQTGGGDYHLTGATNPDYDVVPAGWGKSRYDLDGVLRYQNGRGSSGAYECLIAARV